MSTDQTVTEAIGVLLDADPGGLSGATPLAGIAGWDSVNALRLLTYLERHLGTELDFEGFHAAATVADLAAVVAHAGSAPGGAR